MTLTPKTRLLLAAIFIGNILNCNAQSFIKRVISYEQSPMVMVSVAPHGLLACTQTSANCSEKNISETASAESGLKRRIRVRPLSRQLTVLRYVNILEKMPYIDVEDIVSTIACTYQQRYGSPVHIGGGR